MHRPKSIANSLMIVLLAGASGLMLVLLNADSLATKLVNKKLAEIFDDSEFQVTVDSAERQQNLGFELRGLRVAAIGREGNSKAIATADSAFVEMPIKVADLARLELNPKSVRVRRMKLALSDTLIESNTLARLFAIIKRHKTDTKPVPLELTDSSIEYLNSRNSETMTLQSVRAKLVPDADGNLLRAEFAATGDMSEQVHLLGRFEPASGNWAVRIKQMTGGLDKRWLRVLPIGSQRSLLENAVTRISGTVSVTGVVAGNLQQAGSPQIRLAGKMENGSAESPFLPNGLRNCDANILITNQNFELKRITGHLGNGTFDFRADLNLPTDAFANPLASIAKSKWQLDGSLTNFELSNRLLEHFPEVCRKFCRDFSPAGTFDLQFQLDSAGKKKLEGRLRDMSFSWHRFPFRVENCVGNVNWINDDLVFNVEGVEQQQIVEFNGRIRNPGPRATWSFNFGTDGRLPIDSKLMASLQNYPTMQKAFADFRPVGFVSGHGQIQKSAPGSAAVQKNVQINLHDCRVRHRSFDYPMQNVGGKLIVSDGGFTFEDVTGENSSGSAVCNGTWNQRDGLQLAFLCSAVELDNRLRGALTPGLQQLWDSMRPAGKIRLGRVQLRYLPQSTGLDVRVQADLGEPGSDRSVATASIDPVWFPYRFENLQGRVEIGEGKISLERMMGRHGSAWVNCSGSGNYSESEWNVRLFDLLAGSVPVDRDLLAALPTELAGAVENLQFNGQLNVSGELAFSGSHSAEMDYSELTLQQIEKVRFDSESPTTAESSALDWNLRLDMDRASLLIGLPLENLFGSLRLQGSYDGRTATSRGNVAIDSVTIYGSQVTDISGPIWIDNNQTLAGKFVSSTDNDTDAKPLVGNLFGGEIELDGWVAHEEGFPFFVQTSLEKSDLQEAAKQVSTGLEEIAGEAYGFLRLRGNAENLHSFEGNGNVHLRNARIHQLPVILSLLKILSIKEVTRTAFDTSNIDFTVSGDQIKLDRIELIGDAISLIGNGYMELLQYVDVNFYSVVGRNRLYIPLVSELYQASSQRIMWINIAGSMNNLQTRRKVLPGLDDSLRELFQTQSPGGRGAERAASQPAADNSTNQARWR